MLRAMTQVEVGIAAIQLEGIVYRQARGIIRQAPKLRSILKAILALLRRYAAK